MAGEYFAPQAPSVTNSTAMANNAIMQGFTSAKQTYIKAQERIYEEVMTNFENASNAEALVAKNVGRKGWDELNMSLNDQYLNAINEIKKQQKLKPFDVELKNKLSTLQSKFQQTLGSISQTNQMFDNFSKLQTEGKLDPRLMTRGSNAFKNFLEDIDNGVLSIDVNGVITNKKTGEKGTFTEIIGGAIPQSIYKVDEIGEITTQLKSLRASDPEMKSIINEDGRIITRQSMTPSQKRKIDLYLKHTIFDSEGGLSQIGEVFEVQRQGAHAGVNNGERAEQLDGQGLVDYVKQFFGSDEEIIGVKPEEEKTDKETKPTAAQTKQNNFKIQIDKFLKGDPQSIGALKGQSLVTSVDINGVPYAEGTKIIDAEAIDTGKEYPMYKLTLQSPKGDVNELEPMDLNNEIDLGNFRSTVAGLRQFTGVDPLINTMDEIKGSSGIEKVVPKTTIDNMVSELSDISGISKDELDKKANDLNSILSKYGAKAESFGGITGRGITITDKNGDKYQFGGITGESKAKLKDRVSKIVESPKTENKYGI